MIRFPSIGARRQRFIFLALSSLLVVAILYSYREHLDIDDYSVRSPIFRPDVTSVPHRPDEYQAPANQNDDLEFVPSDVPPAATVYDPEPTAIGAPSPTSLSSPHTTSSPLADCPVIPNSIDPNDLLVVLKTGTTELYTKLNIHFSTTFRCIPHYVIFSDLDQQFGPHHIFDVLDVYPDSIVSEKDSFALYRKLQRYRSRGGKLEELEAIVYEQERREARRRKKEFERLEESLRLGRNDTVGVTSEDVRTDPDAVSSHEEEEDDNDNSNKGWDLDKWKFLPMISKALHLRPSAKWYIFIEADTYLVWSNVLRWLKMFDHTQPFYIGGQASVGDTEFAHGGTGFMISKPAMQLLEAEWKNNRTFWDRRADESMYGDALLAEAFKSDGLVTEERPEGIRLTPTFPIMQGETINTIDWSRGHWCRPTVSQHHVSGDQIQTMYNMEQALLAKYGLEHPILHRDVFHALVEPHLEEEIEDWDNLSQWEKYDAQDLKHVGRWRSEDDDRRDWDDKLTRLQEEKDRKQAEKEKELQEEKDRAEEDRIKGLDDASKEYEERLKHEAEAKLEKESAERFKQIADEQASQAKAYAEYEARRMREGLSADPMYFTGSESSPNDMGRPVRRRALPKRDDWKYEMPELPDVIFSTDKKMGIVSFEGCRSLCLKKKECLQFSFQPNTTHPEAGGICKLGDVVRYGNAVQAPVPHMKSGFLLDRVQDYPIELEPCEIDWIMSREEEKRKEKTRWEKEDKEREEKEAVEEKQRLAEEHRKEVEDKLFEEEEAARKKWEDDHQTGTRSGE